MKREEEKEKKNISSEESMEDVTFESNQNNDSEMENENIKPNKKSNGKNKKVKELEQKVEELNDKYLRLYSEFDNYRKRTSKERIDLQLSASKDLILELLPVVDDFERAIQSFKEHKLSAEAQKGVELIYNKLVSILKKKGVEPIDVVNKDFDTDIMEAVTNVPAGDEMKGKVVDVIQKGYMLNGNVLRYPKVVVGS